MTTTGLTHSDGCSLFGHSNSTYAFVNGGGTCDYCGYTVPVTAPAPAPPPAPVSPVPVIKVTVTSIDGFRKSASFKTLAGARKFAAKWIGTDNFDLGAWYAVDMFGTMKLSANVPLTLLFPSAA